MLSFRLTCEPYEMSANRESEQRGADLQIDDAGRLPAVRLKSAGLHPLVYRKRIGQVDRGAKQGDLVEVLDQDSRRVGYGLFNPKSELTLRMLSRGDDLPDEGWWKRRLEEAVRLRREMLRLDETTDAYRVVHARLGR